MNANLPIRRLPERPDLDQLKRQAKELLAGFAARESGAVAEVRQYYPGAPSGAFALHDAQLVLARAYGFDSWPKLKARVDGVTIGRLHDAVERGDADVVRNLLQRRPELVNRDRPGYPERLPLEIAVQRRDAAMVQLLMERGADARSGIWPYRKDTQAVVMAAERGYDEVVNIIREQELMREKPEPGSAPGAPEPAMEPTAAAVERGDAAWIRQRHDEGALRDPLTGDGLLTLAVRHDRPEMVELLLELGFDPDETRREAGADESVHSWGRPLQECAQSGKLAMAAMLLAHGADANAWACVWNAYRQKDAAMIELLAPYGGVPNAMTPGYLRDTELAACMFRQEAAAHCQKALYPKAERWPKRSSNRQRALARWTYCAWRWSESPGRGTIRVGGVFWPRRCAFGITFHGFIWRNGTSTEAPICLSLRRTFATTRVPRQAAPGMSRKRRAGFRAGRQRFAFNARKAALPSARLTGPSRNIHVRTPSRAGGR